MSHRSAGAASVVIALCTATVLTAGASDAHGAAKPKAGSRCTNRDEVQIYGLTAYRCVAAGKKLIWAVKKITAAQRAAIDAPIASPNLPVFTATTAASSPVAAPTPAAAGGPITQPAAILGRDLPTFKAALVGQLGFPDWWPLPPQFNVAERNLDGVNAAESYDATGKSRFSTRKTSYFSPSLELEPIAKALLAQIPASSGYDTSRLSTSAGTRNDRKYTVFESRKAGSSLDTLTVSVFEVGQSGKPPIGSIAEVNQSISTNNTADSQPPAGAPALGQFMGFPVPAGMTWKEGRVLMNTIGRYNATTSTSWGGTTDLASLKSFYETVSLPAGFTLGAGTFDKPDGYNRKLTYNGLDGELRVFTFSGRALVEVAIDARQ